MLVVFEVLSHVEEELREVGLAPGIRLLLIQVAFLFPNDF